MLIKNIHNIYVYKNICFVGLKKPPTVAFGWHNVIIPFYTLGACPSSLNPSQFSSPPYLTLHTLYRHTIQLEQYGTVLSCSESERLHLLNATADE